MYDRILVPVDGSRTAAAGLQTAIHLAKNQGATLRVLHIVTDPLMLAGPDGAWSSDDLRKSFRERGEAILADAKVIAHDQGVEAETECVETLAEPAGAAIVAHAKQWAANLIVLGTHGRRGIRRLVMGSDAEYVVRTTPVPVLVIRASTTAP